MLKIISFVNVKDHRNFVSASQKVVVVCTPLLLEIIVSILKETAKIDKLSTYSSLIF